MCHAMPVIQVVYLHLVTELERSEHCLALPTIELELTSLVLHAHREQSWQIDDRNPIIDSYLACRLDLTLAIWLASLLFMYPLNSFAFLSMSMLRPKVSIILIY